MKRNWRKTCSILVALMLMLVTLAACGSSPDSSTGAGDAAGAQENPSTDSGGEATEPPAEGSGVLVLYASTPEETLNVMISEFEAATGIKVEVVAAGTAELYKRIEAEGDNPLGDVMLGGMVSSGYLPNVNLWEEYVSPHDEFVPAQFQNTTGKITAFSMVPSALMVNNELAAAAGVEIKGYQDLLRPELAGQVVMPDPAQTSSGWEHLVNALYANGGVEDGWEYVEQLLANDAKLLTSSSAVHLGVAEGEYTVALIAESMADTYILEGLDISKVFMEEGVIVNVDGVAIIKNCQNLESAQAFVDFLLSYEFQTTMTEMLPPRRPIRTDVSEGDNLTPTGEINMLEWDESYIAANKDAMLDQFKDILTNFG